MVSDGGVRIYNGKGWRGMCLYGKGWWVYVCMVNDSGYILEW